MKYSVTAKGLPFQWFYTHEEAENARNWWAENFPLGEFTVEVEK